MKGAHNRGDIHRLVWECFPNEPERKRDFLYRCEETDIGIRIHILSPNKPSRPDWCPEQAWKSMEVPERLFEFPEYKFMILLNATRYVSDGKRKFRCPILKREELVSWLATQGEKGGFEIEKESLEIQTERKHPFGYKGNKLTIAFSEVSGGLVITDKGTFKKTFMGGIGRAKGFGAGLFVLQPRKPTL
jgi:CRISPR system Cascade subunit CasE